MNRPSNWLDAYEADIAATIDRDSVIVNGRGGSAVRADGMRMALKHFKALRAEESKQSKTQRAELKRVLKALVTSGRDGTWKAPIESVTIEGHDLLAVDCDGGKRYLVHIRRMGSDGTGG